MNRTHHSKPMPRVGFLLLAAVTVLSLTLLLLGLRSIATSRDGDVQLAEARTRNLAQSIDQNISACLWRVDLVLARVVAQAEMNPTPGAGDLSSMKDLLEFEGRHVPEAQPVQITDAHGRVVLGSLAGSPVGSLCDMPYFLALRDHQGDGPIVTGPVLDPSSGKWVIGIARRLSLPDGQFRGVVASSVLVDHLQDLLSGFDVGPGGTLTLRDLEGGFITRSPVILKGQVLKVGNRTISSELREIIRSGIPQTTYFTRTPFDLTKRTFTCRRLHGAPLVVLAGLAEDDYLGQWRKDRNLGGAILLAFLAAMWFTVWLTAHFWKQQKRDMIALQIMGFTVENASDALFWITPDARIVNVNEAACRSLGYSREELLQLTVPQVDAHYDEATWGPHFAELRERGTLKFESQQRHRDGHLFPVEIVANFMVFEEGERNCAFVRDITERKLAEESNRALQHQLQQSQKMESLGRLAGGVAHDINNVLGAILGLASMQLDLQSQDSRTNRAFETILHAAMRGRERIKALASFARQSPVEERLVDVNSLLREEIGLLEHTTLSRVRVEMHLAPDLHPVLGDPNALTQVLVNLSVNAVDAMVEGGILTFHTRNLDADKIEIRVEDTGCGMSKEVLEKALDPFFTTKEQGKGVGLGLSMVYSTVRAHRGQLVA